MRSRSRTSRAAALPLALLMAVGTLPLDTAPAEAGRFKFRYHYHHRSRAARHVNRTDDITEHRRPPIRLHFGRSGSSSSASATDDKNGKAKPPLQGSAAAHAARAQAVLAAEQAAQTTQGSPVYEPVPLGKTTEYTGGVTCIAGC